MMRRVIRVLRREIRGQLLTSRNLRESRVLRLRRAFWVAVYLMKALIIGIRGMTHENLGSAVIYRGRRCCVSNWAGSPNPTLAGDGFYEKNCPRDEIKNVRNMREFAHRFSTSFDWHMGSWFSIDVNRRLYGRE